MMSGKGAQRKAVQKETKRDKQVCVCLALLNEGGGLLQEDRHTPFLSPHTSHTTNGDLVVLFHTHTYTLSSGRKYVCVLLCLFVCVCVRVCVHT